MKNNPEIDFYRSDTVHTVLKRYDFSEDEKKIIQSAIVTAKRDKPNIKLIHKADILLKSVTESQDPVEMEKFQMDKKSLRGMTRIKWKREEKKFPWIITLLVIQVVGVFILNYYMANNKIESPKLYSFQEAETLCKTQGKVLPLTEQDAPRYTGIPNELNVLGYWTADKKVIYNITVGYEKQDDGKKHYAVCVDTNGKGIVKF